MSHSARCQPVGRGFSGGEDAADRSQNGGKTYATQVCLSAAGGGGAIAANLVNFPLEGWLSARLNLRAARYIDPVGTTRKTAQ